MSEQESWAHRIHKGVHCMQIRCGCEAALHAGVRQSRRFRIMGELHPIQQRWQVANCRLGPPSCLLLNPKHTVMMETGVRPVGLCCQGLHWTQCCPTKQRTSHKLYGMSGGLPNAV